MNFHTTLSSEEIVRLSKRKEAEWKCDPKYTCAVEVTLSVIGGKWKLLVLRHLNQGVSRFGQLRRAIPGITQTMLTQQLRELEEDGIVNRVIFPEIPPRVEYTVTEFGKTLESVLVAMDTWGSAYFEKVRECKRMARGLEDAEGEYAFEDVPDETDAAVEATLAT